MVKKEYDRLESIKYFKKLSDWCDRFNNSYDSHKKRKIQERYSFSQIEINRILNLKNKQL